MDTLVNAAGCDSILSIQLSLNQNSISGFTVSACDSYTVPSGDETYTQVGTYTVLDTIPNTAGCDSMMTISITMGETTNSTLTLVACDSFVSPSGNQVYTTSGTYTDIIPNTSGCDSVILIDLTVNYTSTNSISVSACDSYVTPSGNNTYTLSGMYTDTILNASGCDSIIQINLTMNESSSSTFNVSECYSYTVPSGDETYINFGSYTVLDTILNVSGCDSVLTINLTLSDTTFSTIVTVACDSLVSPSGDETYFTSGIYFDTLVNTNGCDSVITLDLTVNYSTDSTFAFTVCDSLEFNGVVYYESGNYTQVYTNMVGCDSIVIIDLIVNPTPLKPLGGDDVQICLNEDDPLITVSADDRENLVITGVLDGPLFGGQPKVIELYAIEDIPNLSIYGIGSSSNGNGSEGVEYNFPVSSLNAGEHIYLSSSAYYFQEYFGFAPDFVDSSASGSAALDFNGNDAVELFKVNTLIDQFGVTTVNGSGESWDYIDGWAYRLNNQYTNGGNFNPIYWEFSGPNALDGSVSNQDASNPFPVGQFENTPIENYLWFDDSALTNQVGMGNTLQTSNLVLGENVFFVINDNQSCTTLKDSVIVSVLDLPVISADITDRTIQGSPNGEIDLTITSGSSPYTFDWSNGDDTEDIFNLIEGNYYVIVTDNKGCYADSTLVVSSQVGLKEFEVIQVLIFPNPSTSGIFNVKSDNLKEAKIWVSDMNGKILYEDTMTDETTIDLSRQTKGVYQLFVQVGQEVKNFTLVR
jgi:hypothetical protein